MAAKAEFPERVFQWRLLQGMWLEARVVRRCASSFEGAEPAWACKNKEPGRECQARNLQI
eukprot:2272497-Rhodomonas_salina.1